EAEEELPTVPARMDQSADAQHVLNALTRIDPAFQAPVSLFYLEDYSYPEIAEILGVPLGTVKSRIARGIGQMQKLLLNAEDKQKGAA
ncbi:MAG: RNA polymerase sigma factor, partial [Verrucomicrobiales bacterium]